MFSKACEYGIKSAIYITQQSALGKRVGLKDVAKAIESPEAYTSKILQLLVKNHLIQSDKGPNGGFSIAEHNIGKIKLSSIVSVIDGDVIYKGCGLGLKKCNEKLPCPLHAHFKAIRDELKTMLESTSLLSLSSELSNGITFLKR